MNSAQKLRSGDDVREKIVAIYVSLVPGGRVPQDGERGELDSLSFLEFIVALEQEFGIVVETRELDEANFASTSSTVAYVRGKLSGRPA